ncbi:hypothetical protein ACIBAC_00620 [Streptomyces sp. NPDC051362]|uniref:hypothetical protein n=1 Tax=Streptomyces sp. NPDC051362 TaxID=3365651 RepID=UPI00379BE64E
MTVATVAAVATTAAERSVYPECRRSWMQDFDAPTCDAWITGREIYRAERAQLVANNALREMTSRAEARYWAPRPLERNARHAELTSERDRAWEAVRTLLARRAQCTCSGPDMPR